MMIRVYELGFSIAFCLPLKYLQKLEFSCILIRVFNVPDSPYYSPKSSIG